MNVINSITNTTFWSKFLTVSLSAIKQRHNHTTKPVQIQDNVYKIPKHEIKFIGRLVFKLIAFKSFNKVSTTTPIINNIIPMKDKIMFIFAFTWQRPHDWQPNWLDNTLVSLVDVILATTLSWQYPWFKMKSRIRPSSSLLWNSPHQKTRMFDISWTY